ncbi:MAG: Crp/Fnr family transcriptional regulator [Cyanobacteria bacterium J06635_1]
MQDTLLHRLNQLIPLNPQQRRELSQTVQTLSLSKGEVLLDMGQVSDHIYFVVDGVLRAVCDVDGREITRWFCFEGHFAAAYFSFVYRQPSEDKIVLATDAHLVSLSYGALQALSQHDAVWVDLNRRLLENYYTALLKRVMAFQTQSAAERYCSLLAEHPDIEVKVPLGHLSSYLGMSQETLSRLRAKRKLI